MVNISFSQEKITIEGNVYDVNNRLPLSGIMVSSKYGKEKSVETDTNGHFKIQVLDSLGNKTVMLVFSYPGFYDKEQYGISERKMEVYLVEIGEYQHDNTVLIPYGKIKATAITGAVEKIDFNLSDQIFAQSFEQFLGPSSALVTNSSGAPGEGSVIKIRGYSTIFAESKPLVVVDGQVLGNYQFTETAISGFYHDALINIDPRDIGEISILKDAVSTAMYGAKASNGVILVKTKEAKVGKTDFNIIGHFGMNFNPVRLPVIMDAEDFKPYLLEQMNGSGYMVESYFNEYNDYEKYYQYNNTTDWQDYVFGLGKTAGANLGVRGGDAIAKYYISGGYYRNEGCIENTVYNRYNIRINADIDVARWLKAQTNIGFTYSNGRSQEQGISVANNPMLASLVKPSFLYPFTKDTNNVDFPLTEDRDELFLSNPYEIVNSSDISLSSYNFLGTVNFRVLLTKHLHAGVRVGLELNKLKERFFMPDWGLYDLENSAAKQVVRHGANRFIRSSDEFNLQYNRTFNEINNWKCIIGFRNYIDDVSVDIASGINTPSDEFTSLQDTEENGRKKRGYQYLFKDAGGFSILSYNYMEQYYIDFALSVDMSSNVGKKATPKLGNVPVAISPALGLGWDLTEKLGLGIDNKINYFKLRISAGQTTNSGIDPLISKNHYVPVQYYSTTGFTKKHLINENLKWEKSLKVNMGNDIALKGYKLFVSTDIFMERTSDILSFSNKGFIYGGDYWDNKGILNTLGAEIRARMNVIDNMVNWNTELSVTSHKTTVSNLDEEGMVINFGNGEKLFRNGEKAGVFYGYEVLGVIKSEDEANQLNLIDASGEPFRAGDIKFKDVKPDGVINEEDKVIIGDPSPDVYGSWVNTLTYGDFSLLADISFVAGNDVYNHTRREIESMDGYENQSVATLRRWQIDGQDTDIPKASWGDPMDNSRFSTRWIENGTFLRLKRLTLSMNLNKWFKSTNSSVIYISGINLLTLDKYLGYDPEFAYGNSILWEGIDYCIFPQNKSVMLGVKFGL